VVEGGQQIDAVNEDANVKEKKAANTGARRVSSTTHHSRLTTHQPERVGEILGRLFAARGWGRQQERLRLEETWAEALGLAQAGYTRVAGLRKGILEIIVGNAILLQELAHYQKRRLLEQLRRRLPDLLIHDLRFRAGIVNSQEP
jgi:predicted nucleic acid-binding Zn ribbon protein